MGNYESRPVSCSLDFMDWQAFALTLRLATVTTAILLAVILGAASECPDQREAGILILPKDEPEWPAPIRQSPALR